MDDASSSSADDVEHDAETSGVLVYSRSSESSKRGRVILPVDNRGSTRDSQTRQEMCSPVPSSPQTSVSFVYTLGVRCGGPPSDRNRSKDPLSILQLPPILKPGRTPRLTTQKNARGG